MFVQLVEIVVKRFLPPLYHALGVYLPLITTNCAVLGVTVLNIDSQYTLLESLVNSFGAGIGFLLALVLFSGIREKLENCNIPKSFRGMPSTLIAASNLAASSKIFLVRREKRCLNYISCQFLFSSGLRY